MKNDGSNENDPYGRLSLNGLQLIATSRNIDVPVGAKREKIVALLRAHDAQTRPSPPKQNSTRSAPREPYGWWKSMSVSALRTLAREHGVDVPAGMRRSELVELLVEREVPRPSGQTSGRRRRSR